MSFSEQQILFQHKNLYSFFLEREVAISIFLPLDYNPSVTYPLLLFNDGQDFEALHMHEILTRMQVENRMAPVLVAGIHAGQERIFEYGTAMMPDYAGRGSKAQATTSFVTDELLPYLKEHFHIKSSGITYAGFSLGGLMALDMAWNHSGLFSKAGIFSGALWWRQKALHEGYSDADRIMHAQIRNTASKPALKIWFQCGSLDEYDDRDNDGVIDSIQDTLECISELERKGFVWQKDVFYTEVELGEHNQKTWSAVLPEFLQWAFGKENR
ncbi:alpha/beta hydrolase [Dyadobacter sediminis]|uniref:alpha/beta hydrolase n=1 Tax=Dyadobacter sediminis TaxID=1493691 RepID=UPI001E3CFC33|nr:alpha/beta hydrolase-fold protein [Dyadobacter sediminis]